MQVSQGNGGCGQLWALLFALEHDHVFVKGLQQRVAQAGASIEKAALAGVKQKEFQQWPRGQAIEDFFLMKAALDEVAGKKCAGEKHYKICAARVHHLPRFEGAVRVVTVQPVGDAFVERIVVEVSLEFANRP